MPNPSISPSPSPAPRLEPGKHLHVPKYRPFQRCRDLSVYIKQDKVGQGTFGEVFKARDKISGENVALKKVLMKDEQEGFPITALREIKIMMQLNHENVLAVKEIVQTPPSDFNKQQGSIFLVFDFMEHDLGGLLNRGIEFQAREIMCMSKQILTGMHYIHTNKILHRDMKVANVLMSGEGIIKIADFGLARGCDAKNPRYTGTVCTRWYRPPEILLGERNYTTAIDIWGVGCIVAELFVGRPILQGGGPQFKTEIENDLDQYLEICKLCGTPNQEVWGDFESLPANKQQPVNQSKYFVVPKKEFRSSISARFGNKVRGVKTAIPFIESLLQLDPKKRPSAQVALNHDFFWGFGQDQDPAVMPCKPDKIRRFKSSHEFKVQRINSLRPKIPDRVIEGDRQRAQPRQNYNKQHQSHPQKHGPGHSGHPGQRGGHVRHNQSGAYQHHRPPGASQQPNRSGKQPMMNDRLQRPPYYGNSSVGPGVEDSVRQRPQEAPQNSNRASVWAQGKNDRSGGRPSVWAKPGAPIASEGSSGNASNASWNQDRQSSRPIWASGPGSVSGSAEKRKRAPDDWVPSSGSQPGNRNDKRPRVDRPDNRFNHQGHRR